MLGKTKEHRTKIGGGRIFPVPQAQTKLNAFVSTYPSPPEVRVTNTSKLHPTPRTNSFQIRQPAPVTPVRRPRGGSREALTSIYEGANGSHALTAATRELKAYDGVGADAFADFICRLAGTVEPVMCCLAEWEEMRGETLTHHDAPPNARLVATLTAELFFRATWAHISTVTGGTAYEGVFQQLAEKVLKSTMPLPRFII